MRRTASCAFDIAGESIFRGALSDDLTPGAMLPSVKPLPTFVRDRVAPILRARGFKRSSGTFRAVGEQGVALIAISGRGGIGLHDIDCHVDIGITTHEFLASPRNVSGVTADRITITATYDTWWTRMRDPGLTAMDLNDRWRFDQDDDELADLFITVLEMAADDVLARRDLWPEVPVDSLSKVPTFRVAVPWETRSRWRTDAAGTLDLHYAATSPVRRCLGSVGGTELTFDVIDEEMGVMIGLGPDTGPALTGGQPLPAWAGATGLHSLAGHAAVPVSPSPDGVRIVGDRADAVLVIDAGATHPGARISLGELPTPTWDRVSQFGCAQVVFVAGRSDDLQDLTWRTRMRLADAGRVWWATVPTELAQR
jgi:hypothetical protein